MKRKNDFKSWFIVNQILWFFIKLDQSERTRWMGNVIEVLVTIFGLTTHAKEYY